LAPHPRIFHHESAPLHERQTRGHSKRRIHEHTPYRNTWESTLTAKLALALPLILPLLPNAGMLLDILPLLLSLHGMAGPCTMCPAIKR